AWPIVALGQATQPIVTSGTSLPSPLAGLVDEALARFTIGPEADEADEERELRRAERAVLELLATEGYFDPVLRFEPVAPAGAGARYRLIIELGRRTAVGALDLQFTGALNEARFQDRAAALRAEWPLPVGTPFRSPQWEAAKTQLLAAVQARDFAGAKLIDSEAKVNADDATAALSVEIDSGPAYTVGELQITGLQRYDARLVQRYNPFRVGEPYDRAKLIEFQQALEETPYFSSVLASLQLDPAHADNAPLRLALRESRTKRVSVGVGVASNTGAHLELAYRQTLTFGRPYALQTGARIDQNGGFGYVDLLLPPKPNGARDSIGALIEDSDIEDLEVKRWSVGATRAQLRGSRATRHIETKFGVNFEHEERKTPLEPLIELDTLSTTYTWIRRDVDEIISPRRGNVIELEGTVGASGADLDKAFVRGYSRISQYVPIGERDVLILRGELGAVKVDTADVVPTRFLFRTGGSTTVRGYDYESLGVKRGGATVGGRALALASAEYVHWLERWSGNWGIAGFVDVGDAADSFKDLDPAVGVGVGVRWRTVAGPLAVDVAYGEREKQFRLHFSVAIAF
ncbi:MAG TPA: BamA/TamA family outer membrane protein, partial [Burkholderiaceae bacterium]|nr:BamA/TamA family outer membrane protein [Burkholderiaceae bacterium]